MVSGGLTVVSVILEQLLVNRSCYSWIVILFLQQWMVGATTLNLKVNTLQKLTQ